MFDRPQSPREEWPSPYRLGRIFLPVLSVAILAFMLIFGTSLRGDLQAAMDDSTGSRLTLQFGADAQVRGPRGGPTISASGTGSGTTVTIQVEGADKPKPPVNAPPFRIVIWISGVPYTDQVLSPKYDEDSGQWEFDFDIPAGIKGQCVEISAMSLDDNGLDASVGFRAS